MDGVLVIDKPEGLTSHDVVAIARRCLGERRIGHTGTLDPLATGVLPLACGRATRLARFLTASDKDYVATIRFGLSTDSYDITGAEITRSSERPTPEQVVTALESLRGDYLQMPPAFSAKKVAGQRAYELARKQQSVTLTPAPVRVSDARVIGVTSDTTTVVVTCSAGFYVRSFAHRLGELVGTGACLERLRRTRSGEFDLRRAVSIQLLQEAGGSDHIVPLEQLLSRMPSVRVSEEGRDRVAHGRAIEPRHTTTLLEGETPVRGETGAATASPHADRIPGNWVRLLDGEGRLLAIAERMAESGSLHPCVVLI